MDIRQPPRAPPVLTRADFKPPVQHPAASRLSPNTDSALSTDPYNDTMQAASVLALLQAALSLLALVQSTPNIPQSLQNTAIQTAQQAIMLVTAQLSDETTISIGVPSALPVSSSPPLAEPDQPTSLSSGADTIVSQPQHPTCPAGTSWQQSCPIPTCQIAPANTCGDQLPSCTWGCYPDQIPSQGMSASNGPRAAQ